MTNKIMIDGWNVCFKIPEIAELIPENLAMARKKLNIQINNYFLNKKSIYKIIYDGQPGIYNSEHSFQSQNVQFSKKPQNADQKILKFLKLQKETKKWTLVSSDKELCGRARNLDVQIISSEEFIHKIYKNKLLTIENNKKQNPNLTKIEIKNWVDLFKNHKNSSR